MDLSSHEGGGHEIPVIPISSSYAGGGGHAHLIHHQHQHQHHHHPSADAPPPPPPLPLPHNHSIIIPFSAVSSAAPQSNGPILSSTTTLHHHEEEVEEEEQEEDEEEDHIPYKKQQQQQQAVKYRECLKNHAAAMGGNATDGCGEFMPSGEEGSLEALKCLACNCHRNFHRKEIEGDHHQVSSFDFYHHHPHLNKIGMAGRKVIVAAAAAAAAGHHHHHNHKVLGSEALGYPTATGTLIPSSRPAQPPQQHQYHHHPPQMIMSYNLGGSIPSESDEQEGGGGGHHHEGILAPGRGTVAHHHHHQMVLKKRFRTKFTPEQKEKMLGFAEKVGWRIQKQEEGVVQQFCQEIGVKRRVLKVWMHNNKHNLAKKNSNHSSST